jgi:hypothetical protein
MKQSPWLMNAQKYLWGESWQPDDISRILFTEKEDLFGMDRQTLEAWQLMAAQIRFDTLLPQIRVLANKAQRHSISAIQSLDDIVPLLFQDAEYKSYPMSLLEKGRFDMLTRWLDDFTTVDLSALDTSACDSIDGWFDLIEKETPLAMFHTSGTTGKLAFFPRTTMELGFWMLGFVRCFEGFGDDKGVELGFNGTRMPCVHPSKRYGRYVPQRVVQFLENFVAPTPNQCYTLTEGTLSADLVSLSGRVRVAQSKGELDKFQLSDAMRVAFKRYLNDLERQPVEVNEFMARMMDQLAGQRVFLVSQTPYLVKAAEEGLRRGVRNVFPQDSIITMGGGSKGMNLPANWEEIVAEFTGVSTWRHNYGMTEIIGAMSMCSEGYYHIPPYYIPFQLNPETGAALPRSGTQTGRFACLDLLPQSYWGGIISGDRTTIEWDRECGCGRKGPHIHKDIIRYSEIVTGDDRITCSTTIDNTDTALKALLEI